METFFELLKYTVPALVVFATAYHLLKLYLDDRLRAANQQQKAEAIRITLPLRLQAYERLTLLCDRVEVPNLLFRLRVPGMTVAELQAALLLAVRQEFDHNTSQQLYVSGTLWQIITVARNTTLSTITEAADQFEAGNPADEMVDLLLRHAAREENLSPLQRAIVAIRTEAEQLF
jgi:hypothetical protein